MFQRAVVSLTVVLLFVACSTVPTKDIAVESETDPTVYLKGYTSYAWQGSVSMVYDPNGDFNVPDFNTSAEIKYLIDQQLREKGYVESTKDPQLLVAFASGVDMQSLTVIESKDNDIELLENVPSGALLIAMIDTRTGNVVWAGVAVAEIEQGFDDQQRKQRLAYAVQQIMLTIPNKRSMWR